MSYVIFNLQKHIMHMGTIWGEGFSHLFLRPPETKTFIGLYMSYGLHNSSVFRLDSIHSLMAGLDGGMGDGGHIDS